MNNQGLNIPATEKREVHCKVYLEPSIVNAIKKYQYSEGISSFSETLRHVLLVGVGKIGL